MPRQLLLRVLFLLSVFCALPTAAMAQVKIAVVDFQEALNQVDEGATAMAKLEGMREEKMKSIEKMRQSLANMQTELRNQSSILSESALKAKEEEFMQAQMQFQQVAMGAEQELQAEYLAMMDKFIVKLQAVAQSIGDERGYGLIFEVNESGVVHHSGLDDITAELIKRYNAKHAIK